MSGSTTARKEVSEWLKVRCYYVDISVQPFMCCLLDVIESACEYTRYMIAPLTIMRHLVLT